MSNSAMNKTHKLEMATLGGGCFWCMEAVFQRIDGVVSVISGYSGGSKPEPTYEEVCSGATGHAEAIQIFYDPSKISYGELLRVFWESHDPSSLNRQGPDEGTQYRSVIFYHNERQKEIAESQKKEMDLSGKLKSPVVTEIKPFSIFYRAEDYHQNYYLRNPHLGYCTVIIKPKLEKIEKEFANRLKKTESQVR